RAGINDLKEWSHGPSLPRHFEDATGTMYDGGFLTDIDSPLRLESGTDNGRKDLKALTAACREPNAEKRFAAVDKLLDVDRMITNAVLQVIATDWDGYCRNRNNYRVYFDPN